MGIMIMELCEVMMTGKYEPEEALIGYSLNRKAVPVQVRTSESSFHNFN